MVSIYFFTILTGLIGRDKRSLEERGPMELLACSIPIPSSRKGKAFDAVTGALVGAIFLDAQNLGKNGLKIVEGFLERTSFFE